jgi:hypothetical protein
MANLKDVEGHIPIVEVNATVLDIDKIRLKFFGLPGDCGPDLIMDFDMARTVILALEQCLPDRKLAMNKSLADKVATLFMGYTITKEQADKIIDVINKCVAPIEPLPPVAPSKDM